MPAPALGPTCVPEPQQLVGRSAGDVSEMQAAGPEELVHTAAPMQQPLEVGGLLTYRSSRTHTAHPWHGARACGQYVLGSDYWSLYRKEVVRWSAADQG